LFAGDRSTLRGDQEVASRGESDALAVEGCAGERDSVGIVQNRHVEDCWIAERVPSYWQFKRKGVGLN
jgi:hypothetical protein